VVGFGIDPVTEMLDHARVRGIRVACAVASALPFAGATFDSVLVVTTLCFVDDASAMLREAARVLRPGRPIVIGLIDRESPLGSRCLAGRAQDPFYRDATFYSSAEVEALLEKAGFREPAWVQTLFTPPSGAGELEPTREGRGRGAFLVVRAVRRAAGPEGEDGRRNA
jgi:SAM-dependent methyltransferase